MKKIFYAIVIVAASLVIVTTQVTVGNAETGDIASTGECGSPDTPYYTGRLNPPNDTYDVYVKLGKLGQSATVKGYVSYGEDSSACQNIGNTTASGSTWHKLGTYTDVGGNLETTLQLSSTVLKNLPDANRPSLMLVSHSNPACVPKKECVTTIAGQTAYIRPAGTNLEETVLHVVRVSSVDLANVTKVKYFVDNQLLYETKTLQDFKTEDIPFYANKLIRVLQYESGQIAVIEQNAPEISHDTLWTTIIRYTRMYRNTLLLIGGLIACILLARLIAAIALHIKRRRQWKINHGFMHEAADLAVTPEQIQQLRRHAVFKTIYRYVQGIVVVGAIVAGFVLVSNALFLQIGTVSGLSMWSTLEDGQKIVINKTPVTFARLNNSQYVPQRGAIVVASPNFGTLDTSIEQDSESLIIKRVVGLPGDRVVVKGQHIRVYNKENPQGFDVDESVAWSRNVQYEESSDHIDVTLAENEIFLAGDNRPVSIDSRFNGPITTNQILGVVSYN